MAVTLLRSPEMPLRVLLANVISYVINPLVLPPLVFWMILHHFGAPTSEKAAVAVTVLIFFTLAPLSYIAWMVLKGRAATLEIRDRERRTPGFVAGMVSYGIALIPLFFLNATMFPLIAAMVVCHVVNTAILLLITLRWKISVHLAGLAGCLSMLLFVANASWGPVAQHTAFLEPEWLYASLLLIPLLAWARVRANAHTVGQVTAGALLGFALPYLELLLIHTAGITV